MGAAASSHDQDVDVVMELPPDAMIESKDRVKRNVQNAKEAPACSNDDVGQMERELMEWYDQEIKQLEMEQISECTVDGAFHAPLNSSQRDAPSHTAQQTSRWHPQTIESNTDAESNANVTDPTTIHTLERSSQKEPREMRAENEAGSAVSKQFLPTETILPPSLNDSSQSKDPIQDLCVVDKCRPETKPTTEPCAAANQDGTALETNASVSVANGTVSNHDTKESVETIETKQSLKSPPTESEAATSETANSSMHWIVFKRKYGTLIETEFKPAGIRKNFAVGRVWHAHKVHLSATCSDDCPCLMQLPLLCQSVVTDQLAKDPDWNNPMNVKEGEYPMGLMGHFAGTFLPKLRAQYPTEAVTKLLQRLLFMWTVHQRSKNKFGKRCHDNCKCKDSWKSLFRLGALPGEEPVHCATPTIPKKRKISPLDGHHAQEPAAGQPEQAQGKKRSKADTSNSSLPGVHLNPEPGIQRKSAPASSAATDPVPIHGAAPASQRESYSIDYDCKSSLGFYCVTDMSQVPICKVLSVFPHEPRSRDARIQHGTRILCFELVLGQAKQVRTHHDLNAGFDEARAKGTTMRVTFTNANVTTESVRKSRFFAKDWTNDGQWQGLRHTGWDGGAAVSPKVATLGKFDDILNSPVQPRPAGDTTWFAGIRSKKIRFAAVHSFRSYDIGGCPGEVRQINDETEVKGSSTKRLQQEKAPRPRQATLTNDFEPDLTMFRLSHLSIGGILRHIQSGCLKHLSVVQEFERISKYDIKAEKEKVSHAIMSSPNDRELQRRARDLELITKVLKIAITADHSVKETQSMNSWKKFQVCVRSIDNLGWSETLHSANVDVSATFHVAGKLQNLRPLPQTPFASRIVFGDSVPPYNVSYNSLMAEDRTIKFVLETRGHYSVPRFSCTFLVKLSDLACTGDDTAWRDTLFGTLPGGDFAGAQIYLCVRRVPAPEYVQGKRDLANAHLNDLIDWIARFNKDLADWNKAYNDNLTSIGADIALRDGASLLHSAIYLKETIQLRRLLELNGGLVSDVCLESAFDLTLKVPSLADDCDRRQAETSMDEMSAMLDEKMKTAGTEYAHMSQVMNIMGTNPVRNQAAETVEKLTETARGEPYHENKRDGYEIIEKKQSTTFVDMKRGEKRASGHAADESERLTLVSLKDDRRLQDVSDGCKLSCDSADARPPEPVDDTRASAVDGELGQKRPRNHTTEDSLVDASPRKGSPDKQEWQASPVDSEENEWLLTDATMECRSFRSSHRCNKVKCNFVHVHRMTGADLEEAQKVEHVKGMEGKLARLRDKHRLFKTKSKSVKTDHCPTTKTLWSAAFCSMSEVCPEVCYAVGGAEFTNSENVSWYSKKSDAMDALMKTVIISRHAKRQVIVPAAFAWQRPRSKGPSRRN